MSRLLGISLLFLGACGGTSTYQAKLTEGLSGEPMEGVRFIFEATSDDASLTCMTFEGTSDDQGMLSVPGLCTGSTGYKARVDDDTVWIPGGVGVKKDYAGEVVEVTAWLAPNGDGLYKRKEGSIDSVRSSADLKREKVRDTDKEFLYPSEIPGDSRIALIEEGDVLVIGGKEWKDELKITKGYEVPKPVKIGSKDSPYTLSNIQTVGVKFTSDLEFEEGEMFTFDESKVTKTEAGDRVVHWVRHDALPEGRYMVYRKSGRRLFIVDFGKRPPKKDEEKEEE